MANYFGEVQKLKVIECTQFQAFVIAKNRKEGDKEDDGPQVLFQKLNHLQLSNLENLSTIVPEGYTLKWSSLKTLDMSKSGVEVRILTRSIMEPQTSLSSLQSITIDGARSLNLLSRFIPGGFSCETRAMNVPRHDQLLSVFSPSLIRASFHHLEDITIKSLESEAVFNLEEVRSVGGEAEITALNKLDAIYIEALPNMTHVWRNVPKNFEGFRNLTIIEVSHCNNLRYVFSSSIAKCLVKLQSVQIWHCDMIEDVCTADEEEKKVQKRSDDIVFFPQLQKVNLFRLPRLVCINLSVCDFEKLSMEAPNAETTQMLHHDVSSSDSSSSSALICTEKSKGTHLASMRKGGILRSWSFLHLTSMSVFECDNMSTLFPPDIQVNLPVLEHLYIGKCDNLRYIFSSNPSLRSLMGLHIRDCKMLEVIVKDDDVEEGGGRNRFVFPTLTNIDLEFLPNLEGFCLGKCSFHWPSLTKLEIEDCLKMKIFTSGCSTTPLLDHLVRESIQHNLAEGGGDINTTLASAIEKDVDNSNTVLREQFILTPIGFILAADHLVAHYSSWQWNSWQRNLGHKKERYLIRKDIPCPERARPSNSTRPESKSEFEIDVEDTDHNDDSQHHLIHGPRKYDICIIYDNTSKSADLWLRGYDQQSDTSLPLELILEDIHESYPQECVNERFQYFTYETFMYLNLSKNLSSFIEDLFARQGIQPDIKTYFSVLLSALVPTIKCFGD